MKVENETCTVNQFTCATGFAIVRPLTRCIDRQRKCDHVIDCEDNSDELSCTENFQKQNYQFFTCPNGYSKCQDGKSCYRVEQQTCGM